MNFNFMQFLRVYYVFKTRLESEELSYLVARNQVDAGSESVVQEALDRLVVGRTTVVVAHRLSTIRNVDTIAVIQQGQVVETGTHEELISKDGAYASLIRFQEMVRNRDFSNPSTRRSRSSRLSHSLSTKSLSLRSGSLRNLSYQYNTGADGRIEMVSNAETDGKILHQMDTSSGF